ELVHAGHALLRLGDRDVHTLGTEQRARYRLVERRCEWYRVLAGRPAEHEHGARRKEREREPAARRHAALRCRRFSPLPLTHVKPPRIRNATMKMIHPSVTCMKPWPSAGFTKKTRNPVRKTRTPFSRIAIGSARSTISRRAGTD